MRNRMYGGVRGRKTKVGRKLLRFPPTRLSVSYTIVMAIKLMAVKSKFETYRAVDEGYVAHDSMFLLSAEKFIPTLYIFLPSPAKAAA